MNNTLSSPAYDAIELSIANSNLADTSKDKYIKAWQRAKLAGFDLTDPDSVSAYSSKLSPSAKLKFSAVFGRAVNIWKKQIRNGVTIADVTPEIFARMQLAMWQMDDFQDATPTHKSEGTKHHTWLSREQVEQITSKPDLSTLEGQRDWIVLGILLGAGLRRDELANLTADSLKQQPAKAGMRDILQIKGKGGKFRIIPISPLLAHHLRKWTQTTNGGMIARSINKAGKLGESLSAIGIHNIVRKYGALIGLPELDSHDMRRSFARLGYDSGVAVEQISKLLGHADVKTTMLYLGIDIDIESTVSDFIPLSGD